MCGRVPLGKRLLIRIANINFMISYFSSYRRILPNPSNRPFFSLRYFRVSHLCLIPEADGTTGISKTRLLHKVHIIREILLIWNLVSFPAWYTLHHNRYEEAEGGTHRVRARRTPGGWVAIRIFYSQADCAFELRMDLKHIYVTSLGLNRFDDHPPAEISFSRT